MLAPDCFLHHHRPHSTRSPAQLIAIYTQYKPEKLGDVDRLLKKYEGVEAELVDTARRKYVLEAKKEGYMA